jgi:hypothetical protein
VSTSNHNEILNNSQEDSETELDTELVVNKSQSKDLDLNRIILENRNDNGIIPRNNYKENYVTHTSIIHDYYSIIHNWYLKPPNIQFEELGIKAKLKTRIAYVANSLYNWNINDLSGYEISDILHDIMIIKNIVVKCPNKSDYQISNIVSNQSIKDVLRYKKNIYKNLKHLKYLSSTDFKWYKDILFLSILLIRMNNRVPFWKERFIDYFAHKDKEKFNNCHNDCMSLTYRRIINALKHIELNLCMIYDLRLTNHFKNKKYDKKELGSFYQNGFLKCFISLIVSFMKYKFHKKKIRSYKSYKAKSSKTLHYKFGQISHYKIKDKIIKLNIRFQLLNILFETDTRSEELLQIENNNIISQKDEYSNNIIRLCFYNDKNINALTRKEILELINQIEDLETKIKYLYQIIHYNLIFNRYKQEKYPIISQDLKFEINNIKHKIKELKYNFKTSNKKLVQEIITLQSERQHTKKIIQDNKIKDHIQDDKIKNHDNTKHNSIDKELFINLKYRIMFQKWYVEFQITTIALLDSDADMNCIQNGIIPTKYYGKITEKLHQASSTRLNIEYRI